YFISRLRRNITNNSLSSMN
ncbi:hypothetical protein VCHENC01_3243B, partial [Vibrio harveyi]